MNVPRLCVLVCEYALAHAACAHAAGREQFTGGHNCTV